MKNLLMAFIMLCIAVPTSAAQLPPKYDNKAWDQLESTIDMLAVGQMVSDMEKRNIIPFDVYIDGNKVGPGQVLDVMKILEAMTAGDWNAAGKQTVDTTLAFYFPMVGQYIAVHRTLRMAGESIMENWVQDLYATKAYRDIVDIMNRFVLERAKQNKSFVPLVYYEGDNPDLDKHSALYKEMVEVEKAIFAQWLATDPFIELQDGGNPARLRQVFGRDPSERMTFEHFYKVALRDQLGYIQTTFERVMARSAEQARKRLYEDMAAKVKRFMDKNSTPRNLKITAADGKAVVTFDGMPGYEYEASLFTEGGDDDGKYQLKKITGGNDTNTITFDYELKGGADTLVVMVDDEFGKMASARTREYPKSIDARIVDLGAYGVANGKSRRIGKEMFSDEGLKVVLRVRSNAKAAPAKVWLREKNSKAVLAASSEYSEKPGTPESELIFVLNPSRMKEGAHYTLLAQMQEPVADRQIRQMDFTFRKRPAAKPKPKPAPAKMAAGEPKDVYKRGLVRWQNTVFQFVSQIPGCFGAQFRTWAQNELLKLGHDRNRQKYIGELNLQEMRKDRQGVFAHTGGFWADEMAKHPYDKCRAKWVENMRNAGMISYPKAWHSLNAMWHNAGYSGDFPGPRTRQDAEKAKQRRKANYGNAKTVPLTKPAPGRTAAKPAPKAPVQPRGEDRMQVIEKGRKFLLAVTGNIQREYSYPCGNQLNSIIRQIRNSPEEKLYQIGKLNHFEQDRFRETMYKGVAEKMLGVIMNSPYSSCNKRWIWRMANVYQHHLKKDVRSAYTRKQRSEGK